MPKRASADDDDAQDALGTVVHRRKARISSKFRKPDQATAASPAPSSAFAGMGTTKPGFVFGTGAAGQPSTSPFSLGAPSISASPGSASPTAAGGTPGGGVASGGFSFLSNAPAATPAALSKPIEKKPAPPQPTTAVAPKPVISSAAQGISSSTAVSSGWQGGAFGGGKNAARGGRLNKRFSSWVSHQLAEDAASFLDSGLRDYVAFAAEIRERVNLVKTDPVLTTAFRHPSTSTTVATSEALSKPSEASTSTSSQANAKTPPPVVETPAPAPAPPPVVKPALTFSFDAPSTLPAAPSGPQFSFALPSASTSTPASGGLTTAPSATGFKFNSGGLGAVGASPAAFNGFKVPPGVAIPPPVAAGGSAADEEDAIPKEDPSKLERAPGEENEEVVGHFRAKLFRFKMSEKAWGDMGVGMLRLMKHTTNDSRRMVLRNDMGKVLLNAAVYEGMGVTKAKNTIKFVANVEGDGPTTFMVKVTADDIDDLHTRVVGLVPLS